MIGRKASPEPDRSDRATPWSELEFAARLKESYRVLWIIAVGILRDSDLAEDAVQEAAIIGLQKREQFTQGTSFTAWMGQMVRNVSLNAFRKEKRRRTASIDAEGMADELRGQGAALPALKIGTDGMIPADQRHFDDRVMKALAGLGETARTCLLLRTIEDMEYSEISRLLSIPEGTAMSHVHRTRSYLREQLTDYAGLKQSGTKRHLS